MNQRSSRTLFVRLSVAVLLLLAVIAVFLWMRAARARHTAAAAVQTEAVARRDISQTVEATGTVEPVEIVEIKSKASGQILRMPVEIGSVVTSGDLLAQIDTVNVQSSYDEAYAALKAAQASLDVTRAQAKRSDELFSRGATTADQHESATLAYANAQSAFVRSKSALSTARQALDDATVRAPSAGTIIEQDVTKGQVIASAIQSASGGTTLLKMADLGRVQMNVLVGETDIGNVKPGQSATVTVDAFPNRTFRGRVLKIEPQATVSQSVTMFPVLVSISNEDGALLPGMNGEVVIAVSERSGVLTVPVDAVRTTKELPTVAATMGLNADSVRAQLQRQVAAAREARRGSLDSLRSRLRRGAGVDSMRARGAGGFGPRPGRMGGGPLGGGESGWGGRGARSGRGAWRMRGGGGGWPGAGGFGGGDASGGAPSSAITRVQPQAVIVKTASGLEARVVSLGISDYDYTEVLSGLKGGEEVALLSVAEVQAKRTSDQQQLRQRMGSGMPGVGGGAGGARGGAGGARGAGGGR